VAERLAHLFYRLHLSQCALKGLGGRVHRLDGGMPRFVGGGACHLSRSPRLLSHVTQLLPLLTDDFERFTMLIAQLTCFFGQTAKAFRFLPHGFVHVQAGIGRITIDGGLDACAFAGDSLALGLSPTLFGTFSMSLGMLTELLGLPPVLLCG